MPTSPRRPRNGRGAPAPRPGGSEKSKTGVPPPRPALSQADTRAVVFGLALVVPAFIALVASQLAGLSASIPLALGAGATIVALAGWLHGDWRSKPRLPVLSPGLLASIPVSVGLRDTVGPGVAVGVSIAYGILAAVAFGVTRQR